jgi:hypothetical protein
MKTIDLSQSRRDLREVLDLAGEENLILTTPDGRQFVLAEIDDFETEIRLVREQRELMELLGQRSSSSRKLSLDEVKKDLNLR